MNHLLPIPILFFLISNWCLGQQTICYGSVETYSVDMDEGSGMGTQDSFYAWTVVGGDYLGEMDLPEGGNTNEITIDWGKTPAGNYTLLVEEINNGCFGEQQRLEVIILPAPVSGLSPAYLCVEPTTGAIMDTANLKTGLPESLYGFEWYFEDLLLSYTEPSVTVDNIGTYRVKITNKQSGCQIWDSTTVGLSSPASAEVLVKEDFGDTQKILVTVLQGRGDYEFALDDNEFQDSPEFLVTEAGAYTVTVRDKNGCGEIKLIANVLTFPKFFTPNNDGYNDYWNIDGSLPIQQASVFIYDRYGKMVARIEAEGKGWDGTYDGIQLPSDDYWFVVDYINALQMESLFKSHFTLKR